MSTSDIWRNRHIRVREREREDGKEISEVQPKSLLLVPIPEDLLLLRRANKHSQTTKNDLLLQ